MMSTNQVNLVFDVHSGVEDCALETYMGRYQAKQERQENLKFSLSFSFVAGKHAWCCTRSPWRLPTGPAVRAQTLGEGGK